MRGRSCTQPFLVEKSACRPDAFLLPPRWVSRSPPHPTRLRRPTFPPRGRLWRVETQRGGNVLSQKCFFSIFFRKNAFQIGVRIPVVIAPRPYQRQRPQKPASGNERPEKPGVQGACPRPSFSPFLGRNGDPAGQAGPRGAAPRGRKQPRPPVGYIPRRAQAPGPPRQVSRAYQRYPFLTRVLAFLTATRSSFFFRRMPA